MKYANTWLEVIEPDLEESADRATRLLFWLLKHPFQRYEDLALALSVDPATVHRHLARLCAQGTVEHLTTTSTPRLFYLTSKGIRQVAERVGERPERLATIWQCHEAGLLSLIPQLPEQLRLQDRINSLVKHAPRFLGEQGHAAHLRWHWLHDYRRRFVSTKNKSLSCQFDAVLVLRHVADSMTLSDPQIGSYLVFFMFCDPGWDGPCDLRLMRTRVEQILRWRESEERGPFYQTFPPLLIWTHTRRNAELWQWCAQEVARRLRLAPLVGAVVEQAPTPSSSPWHMSWQALERRGPVLLRDMLVPMTREAIPPEILAPRNHFSLSAGHSMRRSRNKTLVKGQFQARAQAASSVIKRPLRERNAFLYLRLAPRHLRLLHLLYVHPLLTLSQMAQLFDIQEQGVRHILADLRRERCLKSYMLKNGDRSATLAPQGRRLLAAVLRCPLAHVEERRRQKVGEQWEWNTRPRGLPRLIRHATGINHLFCEMTRAAREVGHHLLWWETGARAVRYYRLHGRTHYLFPDVTFAYATGSDTPLIRAWFEWDEGSMRGKQLVTKLRTYMDFVRSGQWRLEYHVLPPLLMVVPSISQEKHVQAVVQRVITGLGFHLFLTTRSLLTQYGPLAPIWLHLGTGRESTGSRISWLGPAGEKSQLPQSSGGNRW